MCLPDSDQPRIVIIGGGFAGYFDWLLWSIVHLLSISGFRNRLMVGFNQAVALFISEIAYRSIIRNFKPKSSINHTKK